MFPRPWLYSETEIDPEALIIIIHSWIRVAFSKAPIESRQAALASIRAKDLVWKKESIDLAQWTTRENGTAAPTRGDTFVLLPHLVAAKLSEPGVSLAYGAEQLNFRRAPLSSGKQGAELVSWPPIAYERAKKIHRPWQPGQPTSTAFSLCHWSSLARARFVTGFIAASWPGSLVVSSITYPLGSRK